MATDLESSSGGNTMGTGTRAESPTRELPVAPAAASEDRCVNCGSPLAHDQRYCVECGERRGQLRFPTAQPTTEVRSRRVRSQRAPRTPRASSGTTLVAGVGVLLLAIGLGVLIGRIGHDNSNQKAAAAPPQVITVNGGGGSSSGSTAPTTTTHSPAVAKGLNGKLKKAASQTAPPSKAVQQKANQAAGKVLGNSKNLAPPTVTTGGSCSSSSQAGCQGGKFTGNFFGQ
ncbi:MAG TPA: hypothetical protein VMB27_03670 [Solirubrobacteraceae bacterium]|nr:hypothetical protein [Solirubrobacteraceae bacterium]